MRNDNDKQQGVASYGLKFLQTTLKLLIIIFLWPIFRPFVTKCTKFILVTFIMKKNNKFNCKFLLTKACRTIECLLTLPDCVNKFCNGAVLLSWHCIATGAQIETLR